jgi:hypothetical protein
MGQPPEHALPRAQARPGAVPVLPSAASLEKATDKEAKPPEKKE